MYKQKLKLVLLLLLGFVFRNFGQITAVPGFTGCAPYSVLLSGPAGATAVFWNFGQGMGTTTLSAPNPIYINPGTYNVTYTALVNTVPVSYTAQITVKAPPSGSFFVSIPASHCAPLTASFTASSPPGMIYSWTFGDLSSLGSGATVTHTYITANSYVPVLTLLDAASGCTAVASSNATIHVSDPAKLLISSSNGFQACVPPFNTSIDGNGSTTGSPLGGGLTYSWIFNTATPASFAGMTPGQVVFGAGQHTVTLTATDNNQCATSIETLVTISNPTLQAAAQLTVCLNSPVPATLHTNQGSMEVQVVGVTGSTIHPTVPNQTTVIDTLLYLTTPGTNTLIYTVYPPGCQSFSMSQVIFVEVVTASFTWTPPTIFCQPFISVNYINQSWSNTGNSLTFTWTAVHPPNASHHGVPSTSIITGLGSPTFTFAQGSLNPYTVYQFFTPNITMNAMSNSIAQCTAGILHTPYSIVRPTANFIKDKKQGCAPLAVVFKDYSTAHPNFPILSYTWCNGAPVPTFSIGTLTPPAGIPTVTFSYASPGTYTPYLIISTGGGCGDISFIDTVTVVNPPTISATFPATACAGQPVTINMSGVITPGVPTSTVMDHWHVTTDNGYFSGCTNNSSPTFPFNTIGVHNVSVTASQAGCKSANTLVGTIDIKGPVGKFVYETTCVGDKKVVKFHVRLEAASSATLDYDDGDQDVIPGSSSGLVTPVLTHTFPASGDYTVRMVSLGSVCNYTFSHVVRVRQPKATITFKNLPIPPLPNALACTKSPLLFEGYNSDDNFLDFREHYTWFYQTPLYTLTPLATFKSVFRSMPAPPPAYQPGLVDPIALDTFRKAGTYTIGLRIKDVNNCVDFVSIPFRITEAKPVFTFAKNPACLSDGVQIINTTQSAQIPPDLINSYVWDFGDFTPQVTSNDPYFNPVHNYVYTPPPTFTLNVMCIATNTLGCIDTTIHKLQINNPRADFLPTGYYTCLPKNGSGTIGFSANQGYATYSVSYGEPPSNPAWFSLGTFTNISHAFSVPGIYQPSLTIIDSDGCRTTESLIINAIGQPTSAISIVGGVSGFCRPGQPILVSSSSVNIDPITNFIWSIGSISSPPPGSPTLQSTYILPVTTVSLTVSMTSSLLCPHTQELKIYTYDPVAKAIITPTVFCLGDNISAAIQIDHDVAQWQWFFGDFVQQPMNFNSPFTPSNVTYPYTTFPTTGANGNVTVTLNYYATVDQANTCRRSDFIPIRVIKVNSDFKHEFDNYAHCLKISDSFTNTAVNFPEINLGYDWDFGDQSTGSGPYVPHTYQQPGVFGVTLTVRDVDYGCKENSVRQMTIFALPEVKLKAKEPVCSNVPFMVMGTVTPGVSGPVTGTLNPAINMDPLNFGADNTFTANCVLPQTSELIIRVTDNNKCENSSSTINVLVQKTAPQIEWDTTVVIGQQIPLNAYVGAGFTYTWNPFVAYLNCDTCYRFNPISTTTMDITYTVSVEDSLRCSVIKNIYRIHIDRIASLDVPSAFTPNGDGVNDVIFPDGWGLKSLHYFRVFNRWGQLVFETNELNVGWDGIFRGVPQNMETYVYQVSADTYSDTKPMITKTGTFKLLR